MDDEVHHLYLDRVRLRWLSSDLIELDTGVDLKLSGSEEERRHLKVRVLRAPLLFIYTCAHPINPDATFKKSSE